MKIITQNGTKKSIILLGVRNGESKERDKILTKHSGEKKYFFYQSGNSAVSIFSPIVDFSVEDVWNAINEIEYPSSINVTRLSKFYDILNDIGQGKKENKNRFGCWTCTVIDQVKSTSY